MVRKITNLDNHNFKEFITNTDQLYFLIKLMYDRNVFFPAQIVYSLRDYFFLRFEFYYNSLSYFVSLVISVWRISHFPSMNTDELIYFRHVWYKKSKFYFLLDLHLIKAPKINNKIPFRFIFLLLEHTFKDYRVFFSQGLQATYRFKFQKLFNIKTEFGVVFQEYHSKYKDELFFENKYKPYLPMLKNMLHSFDNLVKFKNNFLDYFNQRKFNIFIKFRNFMNNFLQKYLPVIGVFYFYRWQLNLLFFFSLLLNTKSLIKSIHLFNKGKYISGSRESSVYWYEIQTKLLLSWEVFILFRFIVNESSNRNFRRRYRRAAKIVRIIRIYRFIKKLVVWNFKIFKRMFNLFFWFFAMLHFISLVDYFIEYHFLTEERTFVLIYKYLQKKYKEIYDFFFTFY
jgi:hypothetical protein